MSSIDPAAPATPLPPQACPTPSELLATSQPPFNDSSIRSQYNIPPDAELIYTDGACPSNGTLEGRAGIGIYFGPNDPRNISARLPGKEHQTNQRAELFAVLKALEILYSAQKPGTYVIMTDSMYTIRGLKEWVPNWVRTRWRTSQGRPVVSKDLFKRAYDLMNRLAEMRIIVNFQHVPGHSGIPGNEMADQLAVKGAWEDEIMDVEWESKYDDDELDAMAAELENV